MQSTSTAESPDSAGLRSSKVRASITGSWRESTFTVFIGVQVPRLPDLFDIGEECQNPIREPRLEKTWNHLLGNLREAVFLLSQVVTPGSRIPNFGP